MASASGYNHHRFARAVLKKSRKWEPSLTIQLYASHWRFENSPVTFAYNGPMLPFLVALRSQVIPASLIPFLYDIRPPVSFVDGCLVVQIHDHRRQPETKSRVVMRPAAEALAQTIDVMLERKAERWDETLALELESRIIAATSPPLYLGTSILATRNATLAMGITAPAGPNLAANGSFRNPSATGTGDERSESEILGKLLHAGERTTTFEPKWSVLRLKEHLLNRRSQALRPEEQAPAQPNQNGAQAGQAGPAQASGSGGSAPGASGSTANGSGGLTGAGASAPAAGGENKPKKSKKKRPAEEDSAKPSHKKKKVENKAAASGGHAGKTTVKKK